MQLSRGLLERLHGGLGLLHGLDAVGDDQRQLGDGADAVAAGERDAYRVFCFRGPLLGPPSLM